MHVTGFLILEVTFFNASISDCSCSQAKEGKDMKADGYVYENYELKQKEVK